MQQINTTNISEEPQHQYSKKLLNKAASLLEYSQQSRKQFQELVAAFQKRIDIELNYAKNLQQVSKQLDKFIQPDTQKGSSYVCSAFKVDNQQRAHQAKQLAQSIRTQIFNIANDMLKDHTASSKKMEKDVKKYNKQLIYFEQNFQKAQANFKSVDKESEQLIITKNIVKFTSELPQEKKIKMIGKALESLKQKKQYQKAYVIAVQQYNQFVKLYKKDVQQILMKLEIDEYNRIKLQSDCMRKLIVCQISMFKNVQYDLINISKQMETINPKKDIDCAVKEVMEMKEEKEIKGQFTEKILLIDNSLLSISLRKVQEEYFGWMLNLKKNKSLRLILEQRWKLLHTQTTKNRGKIVKEGQIKQVNGSETILTRNQELKQEVIKPQMIKQQQNSKVSQKQISQNVENIKTSWEGLQNKQKLFDQPKIITKVQQIKSLSTFQDFLFISKTVFEVWSQGLFTKQAQENIKKIFSIHLNRIIAGIFIEQYRIQHQVVIQSKNIKPVTQLISLLLESCLESQDVFTARNLIGLLFTFSYHDDKNNKKLLYLKSLIFHNKLWKMHDFWDASIFQSTYQEMAIFTVQKGETFSETVLRQKNIIFSQLASYCHYMIMLGISSKNVRLIVGRYCRLYEMSEQQNKDLSKMITNTYKQYKEMNSNMNNQSAII